MPSFEKLKEYEISQERVDKGVDIIDSLSLIINAYKDDRDVDFRVYANILDDIKQEIEESIEKDVEIVDKYEHEEHEDEVRCINERTAV